MVPGASPPKITRVLAAVDFSSESAFAIETAAAVASAAGLTEIQAAHIYFDPAVARYEGYGAIIRGREQQSFDDFIAPLNLQGVSVQSIFQESSHVADALLRIAGTQKADLIVMGSRGMSPAASVLLGSESEHLLMHSPVPVLIVRRPGSRQGLLDLLLGREFPLKREPRFG
jgi:nucleotide-binding universal stress UspA family protein